MRIAAALLASTLLMAGCGGSDEPSTYKFISDAPSSTPVSKPSASEGVEVGITIKDGKVTPQGGRVKVSAGGEVYLEVTSDAAEEIHVHSDPEHSFEVKAGDTKTFSFRIDTPGQVAIEAHHLDVTILQLVVEP